MRITKKDRQEATEILSRLLTDCKPGGSAIVLLIVSDWTSSASGLTCSVDVRRVSVHDGRPEVDAWLTRLVAMALGLRFNAKREMIRMGGYGYCRSQHVADDLARIMGYPVICQAIGEAFSYSSPTEVQP